MRPVYFSVDITMERVPLDNRWVSEKWQPASVVAHNDGRTEPSPPECVQDGPAGTQWRFPGMAIELHSSEAEGYYLNLTSETPMGFIMWRPADDGLEPAARATMVTVSYNQAARSMDGGEKVDPLPMPDAIRAWMTPFVAEHYKPEPRRKVKRNDPFKDGAFQRDRIATNRE